MAYRVTGYEHRSEISVIRDDFVEAKSFVVTDNGDLLFSDWEDPDYPYNKVAFARGCWAKVEHETEK